MKRIVPTTEHLSRLYYELGQIGARSVGEKFDWPYTLRESEELFALAADWSRWDPRLLEILVYYGMHHWRDLKPQRLRDLMREMETPQTVGVIATFIGIARPDDTESMLFWSYVTKGLVPVSPQFYFYNLHLPGSRLAERTARESLSEFKQWGFLGRERGLIDSATKTAAGTWDASSRMNVLRLLFEQKASIQFSDYLEALAGTLSRQQALLDLKVLPARRHGKG